MENVSQKSIDMILQKGLDQLTNKIKNTFIQ